MTGDGFFYPPHRSTIGIARRSGITGAAGLALSTMPGRLVWAAYLRRRVPAQAGRLALRGLRDATAAPRITVDSAQRRFRGAVLVVVGPGERENLAELVESVRHYEGSDIKIVVADDATGEYPESLVRRRFPTLDFVRARIPGGNASCSYRTQQLGLLHLLNHYDVPVILKLDPDSLMIGHGAFDLAIARFAADPRLGELGTTDRNASGALTDYRFSVWMAHPEIRWSRRWRHLVGLARQRAGHLRFAQGGGYFVARRAFDAARDQRLLPFRQPSWSLLTEDVVTGLIIQAAGYRVDSFGAPGEPIASDTRMMPVEPQTAVEHGFKVVHSVRSTPAGRSEAEVRGFFRAERQREGG